MNKFLAGAGALVLALGGVALAIPTAALADEPTTTTCVSLDSVDTTVEDATTTDPTVSDDCVDPESTDPESTDPESTDPESTDPESTDPADVVDLCANIDDVQETVPDGYTADGTDCVQTDGADVAIESFSARQGGGGGGGDHCDTDRNSNGFQNGGGNNDNCGPPKDECDNNDNSASRSQNQHDQCCEKQDTPRFTSFSNEGGGDWNGDNNHNKCISTATVSFGAATCTSYGTLILGDTSHATFGAVTINGGQYSVTATADNGYHFESGQGVYDQGKKKKFQGWLPPKLTGAQCVPAVPSFTVTQPTCYTDGTYTLGGTDVQWYKGADPVASGLYSLASGVTVDLTVAPIAPHPYAGQTAFQVKFVAPTNCTQLTTLAYTGSGNNPMPFWAAGITILAGAGAVLVSRKRRIQQ